MCDSLVLVLFLAFACTCTCARACACFARVCLHVRIVCVCFRMFAHILCAYAIAGAGVCFVCVRVFTWEVTLPDYGEICTFT